MDYKAEALKEVLSYLSLFQGKEVNESSFKELVAQEGKESLKQIIEDLNAVEIINPKKEGDKKVDLKTSQLEIMRVYLQEAIDELK